ncbi:MAG: hypothetical protein N4A59_16410, partial [Marinifilum sp.]|nr:hypothetical protein [Marinifilum sp.]
MNLKEIVVVINPGSTSTKLALYNRDGLIEDFVARHLQKDLDRFNRVTDQFEYRFEMLKNCLGDMLAGKSYNVIGIVGRGGIVKPLEGGTYRISNDFLEDAKTGKYGDHASNLGSMLANKLANHFSLDESYT